MHWTDAAIVLSSRKFGETSAVIRVLAREHGVFGGVMRGAHSKANRGVAQSGNVISASWNARLSEQLGTFKAELLEPHAIHAMADAGKLSALTSACALVELSMPERHPYPKLFAALHRFLHMLDGPDWQKEYIIFELSLLAESGFGLDFRECAATGATHDLIYISPKSARAVSREAGEPYKEKLLPLPQFLLPAKALPLEGRGLGGGDLTLRARELRKNQTDAEKALWRLLSRGQLDGYKFRRQHPMGNKYIVDFICLEQGLVIELDGGQHAQQVEYDQERTAFLEAEGFVVLRFWNNEVMENSDAVWDKIVHTITSLPHASPPPNPPPSRGRAKKKAPCDYRRGPLLNREAFAIAR